MGVQTQSFARDCCRDAVEMLSKMGFNTTKCPRTISNWNIVFRERNKFPHPNPHIANGIRQKPTIFELLPALEVDCKEFIFKNFDNFGVEMLRDKLVLSLFPKHISILMSGNLMSTSFSIST